MGLGLGLGSINVFQFYRMFTNTQEVKNKDKTTTEEYFSELCNNLLYDIHLVNRVTDCMFVLKP